MFFEVEKLGKRIAELEPYRYRDAIDYEEILVKEGIGEEELPNPVIPESFEDFQKEKMGLLWSGWDSYLWLHLEAEIPEAWKDRTVVGLFDFGKTGGGNNSGFEAMLYVDGKPFQGVDTNHQEVLFRAGDAGRTKSLTFRLWSGMEGGGVPKVQEHQIKRAALAWLDEKADDLYYLAKMMLETVKELPDENRWRQELLMSLGKAFRIVDWSYPGSEEFYRSVSKADEELNSFVDAMDKQELVTVNCVGHTHIDVAWLWRLKHTREKASRSFSTVLRLMERFDDYLFLQTQPQIYDYIKTDFPEIYEQIQEKVKEGKWEIDGAMWVEADCNLTSGESLTRQILIGSRFMQEEFGKTPEFLWLPDVFGYSWAMPQILKKSGIPVFMTTKISWNEYNRMPHDTFYWKGMDGSEVLTHFITTPDADSTIGPWFYTYNGMLTPYTVKGVWKGYKDKNLTKDLLISYGFGDGGGGVNREALEQRRRMDKIPGLPRVKTKTAGAYFRELQEQTSNTDEYVHTWDGELYLEFHRGTYTSHAYNKKMNRKMEFLYREAEWLTVMAALAKDDIRMAGQEELTKGWKILLRNQFHDIIPGSSILPVYEDSQKEYEEAQKIAEAVEKQVFSGLLQEAGNTYTVLNNAGWERSELAEVPEGRPGIFKDLDGNVLESQRADGRAYVQLNHLPAMGGRTIFFEEAGEETIKSSFEADARHVETPFYSIELNEYGQLTRIYDKEYQREVLARGERGNVLQMFEDKPLDFDAWNIDIFYQEKMREITDLISVEVAEKGALRAVLRFQWRYMGSTIWQDMVLYARDRRIDFVTRVDYREKEQLMKVCFPVDIRATEATYDIQYGNVKRPTHWNTSWDLAKFETVAHRWADLSEYGYGVSLLNDCKYGHDIKENRMRLTLLKSSVYPDYKQEQGLHEFVYALYPHGGDFVEGRTVQEAYSLNQPLKTLKGTCPQMRESFVAFDTDTVELDAVKRSEDGRGVIVRFHEFAGGRKRIKVKVGFSYRSCQECDLMERPTGKELGRDTWLELEVTPYEIKTLLFQTEV